MRIILFSMLISLCFSCSTGSQEWKEDGFTYAKVSTEKGDMVFKLYNSTPKHRDNFIKLAKEGFYNGLMFHRVMDGFMIQGGDPDSRDAAPGAQLGQGGPGYKIDAEFGAFHKKGALAAARQPDQVNPEKQSSGSQFYIVQGKKYTLEELTQMEKDMSSQSVMKKVQAHIADPANKSLMDTITIYQQEQNMEALQALQNRLLAQFEDSAETFSFSPEQMEIYTNIGGTPFLDGDYTVFGEIVEGMELIDSLASIDVAPGSNRPTVDSKMEVTIIE